MPTAQIWIDDNQIGQGTYDFRELDQTNTSLPGLGGRPAAQLPGSARFEYELRVERAEAPLSVQQGERVLQAGERRYDFAIEDVVFEDDETGAGHYLIVTQQQLPEPGTDAASAVDMLPD